LLAIRNGGIMANLPTQKMKRRAASGNLLRIGSMPGQAIPDTLGAYRWV